MMRINIYCYTGIYLFEIFSLFTHLLLHLNN